MLFIPLFIFEKILKLLFPNVCASCEEITQKHLCENCKNRFEMYKKERILYTLKMNFNELLYLYSYEGIVRETIIKYKFGDKPYIYRAFANEILNSKIIYSKLMDCDIIIPVPMHRAKKNIRGYNQSELICKKIAKNVENKYYNNILLKKINNKTQSTLSKFQRQKNVLGVYDINKKYISLIKDKKVLLFDDIYTTGATLNECSKVLKKYGAKKITAVVLAKD